MMEHIRSHVVKDTGSGHRASYREHCDYCLSSFPDTKERLEHEGNFHQFISSFKVSVQNQYLRVPCLILFSTGQRWKGGQCNYQGVGLPYLP